MEQHDISSPGGHMCLYNRHVIDRDHLGRHELHVINGNGCICNLPAIDDCDCQHLRDSTLGTPLLLLILSVTLIQLVKPPFTSSVAPKMPIPP